MASKSQAGLVSVPNSTAITGVRMSDPAFDVDAGGSLELGIKCSYPLSHLSTSSTWVFKIRMHFLFLIQTRTIPFVPCLSFLLFVFSLVFLVHPVSPSTFLPCIEHLVIFTRSWTSTSSMFLDFQNCEPEINLYKLSSLKYFVIATGIHWNGPPLKFGSHTKTSGATHPTKMI